MKPEQNEAAKGSEYSTNALLCVGGEKDITDMAEVVAYQPLLTSEYVMAWKDMRLSKDWQIKRISEWAEMLEKRVAELDPNYRSYPFGRNK